MKTYIVSNGTKLHLNHVFLEPIRHLVVYVFRNPPSPVQNDHRKHITYYAQGMTRVGATSARRAPNLLWK